MVASPGDDCTDQLPRLCELVRLSHLGTVQRQAASLLRRLGRDEPHVTAQRRNRLRGAFKVIRSIAGLDLVGHNYGSLLFRHQWQN
jgi:hypothetical protein